VQVEEGAGVSAFLVREPLFLPRGGYGSVAAEAYGITGSVFVVAVLEVEAVGGGWKTLVGHEMACFQAGGNSTLSTILRFGNSTLWEVYASGAKG
jgi:hypothetical protein